jgi:hypothetical protein
MIALVAPFTLIAAAEVVWRVTPNSTPSENSFSHVAGDVVGFYSGYAVLAGTIVSIIHTFISRRRQSVSAAQSSAWGALLGGLTLLPQAAFFGGEFWFGSMLGGVCGGLLYGLVISGVSDN